MLKFIARRALYTIPILFGVTLVMFLLFNVAGGDPAAQAAGRYATAAQIATMRHQMGLDRSMLQQYFDLLRQIFTLDFGSSWSSKQPISVLLSSGLGPSLSVSVPAFVISLLINIPLGLLIAYRRNSWFDKTILVICLGLLSISSVVYVLAGQYLLSYKLGLFPISGWDPDLIGRIQYVTLPVIILMVLFLGGDLLFFRTVFLEEIHQDYVRTARSKGVSERRILFKHILRNGLVSIITLIALEVPFLIVGSLLIESYFGIPGVGNLVVQAIQEADFPVIKAMTILGAVIYIFFQLISDVLCALVDPKIRLN
jgi:peptide/nickel transport system permease protein